MKGVLTMLRIYGASDDLVELDGIVYDELGAYNSHRVITVGDDKGGLRVIAEYAPKHIKTGAGVWRLSVEPIEEDVPCPWPVRVEVKGYSTHIVIDCPEGTPVTWEKDEDEED
jgi:hypothetical protein